MGVLLALGMALSAARRRRVPTAVFSFVIAFGPWWDGFILLGAVYIVFAFLLVRAGRQVLDDQGGPRR